MEKMAFYGMSEMLGLSSVEPRQRNKIASAHSRCLAGNAFFSVMAKEAHHCEYNGVFSVYSRH